MHTLATTDSSTIPAAKHRSLRALEATTVFLADVQTGLGPFLAAYLASSGWWADRVGRALTPETRTGAQEPIPSPRTI